VEQSKLSTIAIAAIQVVRVVLCKRGMKVSARVTTEKGAARNAPQAMAMWFKLQH